MLVKLDDYKPTEHKWLIPGILSNALTLLSGEPKVGKSLFATHMVESLLNQKQFLGREIEDSQHKIAWMGFDSLWISELQERIPNNNGRLYIEHSTTFREPEKWKTLNRELKSEGISLLVIDHLYGLADGLDLNNHNEVDQAMKPVMEAVNQNDVPVLLIAHAGKQSSGRAAHSIAIEGNARHLLRITNSKKNLKLLQVKGNRYGDESLKIELDLDVCRLMAPEEKKIRERTGVSIEHAKKLLNEAPIEALQNKSAAGRWLNQAGISSTDEAGRVLVGRLLRMGLLTKTNTPNSVISVGPNLK